MALSVFLEQVLAGLLIEDVHQLGSVGEVDSSVAAGELGVVILGGGNDNDDVLAFNVSVQMQLGAHHFANIDNSGDTVLGQIDMNGTDTNGDFLLGSAGSLQDFLLLGFH